MSNATDNEKDILRNIFQESILINIRTYDSHSLVLYANDHLNNFVHLYITNSNEVVYLYNYGDEIVNLTIVDDQVSNGISVQVAVIRTEADTTMVVNNKTIAVDKGYRLLREYSNRPWINPEKGKYFRYVLCIECYISVRYIHQILNCFLFQKYFSRTEKQLCHSVVHLIFHVFPTDSIKFFSETVVI